MPRAERGNWTVTQCVNGPQSPRDSRHNRKRSLARDWYREGKNLLGPEDLISHFQGHLETQRWNSHFSLTTRRQRGVRALLSFLLS